jgi:transcriptional regulator GlxA family with amidase domain
MGMDFRINSLLMSIDSNTARPFCIASLAQDINLSASRCHSLFKNNVGISPLKYIHNLRLERARCLLETTFLSVKEIMMAVGINDRSYLRAFKCLRTDSRRIQKAVAGLSATTSTAERDDSISRTLAGIVPSILEVHPHQLVRH